MGPGKYRLAALAALPLFALLLWGVVVLLKTPHGTLVVEVHDPDATVQVLNEEGKILVQGKAEKGKLVIGVDPGKRQLRIEKDGIELFAEEFTGDCRGQGDDSGAARIGGSEAGRDNALRGGRCRHRGSRTRRGRMGVEDRRDRFA